MTDISFGQIIFNDAYLESIGLTYQEMALLISSRMFTAQEGTGEHLYNEIGHIVNIVKEDGAYFATAETDAIIWKAMKHGVREMDEVELARELLFHYKPGKQDNIVSLSSSIRAFRQKYPQFSIWSLREAISKYRSTRTIIEPLQMHKVIAHVDADLQFKSVIYHYVKNIRHRLR
jgi:hypothetical protein